MSHYAATAIVVMVIVSGFIPVLERHQEDGGRADLWSFRFITFGVFLIAILWDPVKAWLG